MSSQQNGTPKIEAEAQDLNSGIQSQTKIWRTRIPEPLPLEKYPVFRLPAVLEEVIKKDFLDRQNNFNSELPVEFKSITDIITTFKLEFEDYDSKVMESNEYSNRRNKEERQKRVPNLIFLISLVRSSFCFYDAGVLDLQFFKSLMKFFGKRHGNIKIEYGDVTEEKNHSMVTSSTFIFANNIEFRKLNTHLKSIFQKCHESTQIVSTEPFFATRNVKFDTRVNKKDELFKICKVRSVKEKQLEVVEENTGWKTESTKLYLITIEGKVTLKEKEPVEEMEFEETPSENIRDNGRVKFKAQKVQKTRRNPTQKPAELRKPACGTMVPCQNECCTRKIKFSRKAGRYQFVLHAFIHSKNQFDAFWDCNVCGFRCGSFQRNRNHYTDHHPGTTRTGHDITRLLQTYPNFKKHFAACFGDHIEL
ncbi:Protein CBG00541 [Caenorhabditis briggsae]|uniref:Histone-lysine N-methyltransferase, H3 lysine-79 specific n=1 Tax=Caenorhabditis briggsae TaxID=6238 RepID=A8WNM9_CAEBR|nr:Protein CBG00541 [Caenorhabditis briggsae]CAP22084.2 Protein CBG00541 [Caenorhabditis briggsae]